MRKKIAVILSRFPFPIDKGDKLRAYHQLKYLSQYHDVHLYCLHHNAIPDKDFNEIKKYCAAISLFKINKWDIIKGIIFSLLNKYPIQVGYFFSNRIKIKMINDINTNQINDIYCQLSRTALYAVDFNGNKIIDFQDAFATNYKRISEQTSGIVRLFYKREYQTMKKFEQLLLTKFNKSTIISNFDKSEIDANNDKISVIPNGVDFNYFTSSKTTKLYDLCFIGNLSYLPNKNAVLNIIKKIVPLLKSQMPNIKINIAGADTPSTFYKYADNNITISGYVKDIREVYNTSKIFVAPLYTGAGLQNKILEAMCMNIPCITTSIVNQSLNAIPNQQIIIANNENEFAEKIIMLLQNQKQSDEISANARLFIESNFSWEHVNKKLLDIL